MNEYIFFMFNDATDQAAAEDDALWATYLTMLRQTGQFDGGSSVGAGERVWKDKPPQAVNADVTGYIRVRARNLIEAKRLLVGNPVYEAGGSVEVRALPKE